MSDQIRISAKNLGALALPDLCPRCFWLKLRLGHRLPYRIFPGIFSSIDSYSKWMIHSWFDRHGEAPPWLQALGALAGYRPPPHHSEFQVVDKKTNILLTGSPDGMFVRPDGSYLIVDYKTGRHTATEDRLYPMYQVQLNAYARIAEACGLAPVTGLALVYTEPVTDPASASQDGVHRDDGFVMGFVAHVVAVPLKTRSLAPLLARTRQIHDLPSGPAGRKGCRDCQLVERLVGLQSRR